uniref:Uncharacterized protein n=1 Tax=Setaria digitata TaxID=48799 RepID=A0A915PXC2_9BILA
MAKSIRSKSKRRMRVIKRERLAPRVLKRLQATVTNLDCSKTNMEFDSSGKFFKCGSQPECRICKGEFWLRCIKFIYIFSEDELLQMFTFLQTKMEIDSASLNLKTMKKSDGSYPIWLSQRKIKKKKKIERKIKQNAKRMKGRRKC